MKTIPVLLLLGFSLLPCFGEEDPHASFGASYETFSVSRVRHIVNGSQVYSDSAIGVDDTFDTAEANVRKLTDGTPFGPPTDNLGYVRILTSEDEFGITVIQVRHFGGTRIVSHDSDYHDSDVNTACHVLVEPFRVSGNFNPISIDVECKVQGTAFRDPEGTLGKSEVSLSASHVIHQASDSSLLSFGLGRIQHDSKLPSPNHVPRFLSDFSTNGGNSISQGGGQYLSRTSYTDNFVAGYLGRLRFSSQTVASFVSENLRASDDESWRVTHSSPVYYKLSSQDPNVRFRIVEHEAPTPRPDLSIGKSSSNLKGNNLYASSAKKAQTAKIKQGKRRSKTIFLSLENDGPTVSGGNENNSISFRGPRKKKKLRFSYLLSNEEGTRNITAEAIAGSFRAPAHLPGGSDSITVQSRQKKSRHQGGGKKKDLKVNFVATNSGAGGSDVTRALIRTR